MATWLLIPAGLVNAAAIPVGGNSEPVFHDQVLPSHQWPVTCATCRYVTMRSTGPQQYRMTRVGRELPARLDAKTDIVFLVDGVGGVSQYLASADERRATGWEIQAAVSTSAARFCDFSSVADAELAVEYYERGHEVKSIDDKGIVITQSYAVPFRKNGTYYVFRDEESAACGTPAVPAIAKRLLDVDAGQRPDFTVAVQEKVQRKLQEYSDIPEIPKPELPPATVVMRDEFETSAEFNRRVDAERRKREGEIYQQQAEFRKKVEQRNQLITSRDQQRDAYKDRLTRQATITALGKLVLRNAEYDADEELMYVDVESMRTNFSRRIAFEVPRDNSEARNLKNRLGDAEITLRLNVDRNSISVRDAMVGLEGYSYAGNVTNASAKSRVAQVINLRPFNGDSSFAIASPMQLQSPDLVDSQALRYDDGSVQDDVRGVVSALRPAPIDSTRWLFVFAIENYENADPVVYAKNSATLLVQAFQKKFGISSRNTYDLIDDKATAGAFRDRLATMLANVKAGDTVYFYYSGHGIPDQKTDEAYILPKDKMVGFVANEDHLRLSKIYGDLSASAAGRVYVFVDSCFSGKTDNVSNFKGVAPGVFRTNDIVVDSKKMTVITAGKYNQFSNAYVERGHRMFSYFLLKSLLKNRSSTAPVAIETLYQEIAVGVREASNAKGDAYLQEPTLEGDRQASL